MKERTSIIILLIVTLVVLAFKLSVSLDSEFFTEPSYFHLRQMDNIKETGKPLLFDELSYQGREYKLLPLYHYSLAFLPDNIKKVVTNLFLSLTAFFVFFLTKRLTKDNIIALYGGLLSLFIPGSALISNNILNPISLLVPLYVLFLFFYIKKNQWGTWPLIITIVLMLLTSPVSMIFVIGLGIFLVLQRIQGMRPAKQDLEISIFFVFLAAWLFAIIFKGSVSGWNFIWGNTPSQLVFSSFSSARLIASVGMLPLLLGLIGANKVFSRKNRQELLVLSMGITFVIALFSGMMPLIPGLALLGITASILAGIGLKGIKYFSSQSKFSLYKIFTILMLIIFASTTILPFIDANINQQPISKEIVKATKHLEKIDGTIISSPEEAHAIMYFSGKRTYFDSYYPFANSQERYANSLIIYRGNSLVSASQLLDKEGIDYIFFSEKTKKFYRIDKLRIASLGTCLTEDYDSQGVIIYENECAIE